MWWGVEILPLMLIEDIEENSDALRRCFSQSLSGILSARFLIFFFAPGHRRSDQVTLPLKTFVMLQHRHGYDSEPNHESTQSQILFA